MKQIFTISIFLLLFVSSFGQNMDKGIYMGKKSPFTVCYLTYTDSIIEVEFFYEKSSQIFGHTAPKKLKLGKKSSSIQPILISNDDSIKVYAKSNHLLIKRKGYGKIKAYKTSHTQAHIQTLRNRQKLFFILSKTK